MKTKKSLVALTAILMAVNISACGSSADSSNNTKNEKEQSVVDIVDSEAIVYDYVTVAEITFPPEAKIKRTDKNEYNTTLKIDDDYQIKVWIDDAVDEPKNEALEFFAGTTCEEYFDYDYDNVLIMASKLGIESEVIGTVNGFCICKYQTQNAIGPGSAIGYIAFRNYGTKFYKIVLGGLGYTIEEDGRELAGREKELEDILNMITFE